MIFEKRKYWCKDFKSWIQNTIWTIKIDLCQHNELWWHKYDFNFFWTFNYFLAFNGSWRYRSNRCVVCNVRPRKNKSDVRRTIKKIFVQTNTVYQWSISQFSSIDIAKRYSIEIASHQRKRSGKYLKVDFWSKLNPK